MTAIREARTAVSLDHEDAYAYVALGFALQDSDLDEAIAAFEQALSLNPNSAFARHGLGRTLVLSGRPEKGRPYIEEALRLSPRDPLTGFWYWNLGSALFAAGDYTAALDWSAKGKRIDQIPQALDAATRLAALALLGHDAEILGEREKILSRLPDITISRLGRAYPKFGKSLLEGLRKAGLPE